MNIGLLIQPPYIEAFINIISFVQSRDQLRSEQTVHKSDKTNQILIQEHIIQPKY